MKRKTIILLSSVLAGSLLVGGAFATWAVTDNADKLDATFKTKQGETPDAVTLTWGKEEALSINDLEANQLREAAHVVVKADVQYEGIFSVALKDTTTPARTDEGAKLFDNLDLYIYSGNVELTEQGELPTDPAPTKVGEILHTQQAGEDGLKKFTKEVEVEDTEKGVEFTVIINLPVEDTAFGQMAADEVTMYLDWDMGADSEPASTEGYFLKLGDANPTALTENTDTDKTDGRIAEYTTTKEVVAGQAIKIVKDGVAVDSDHVEFEENGNATSAGNIVASGESTFWIKVYNGQDQYVGQLFYVVYVTNPSSGVVIDDNVIYGTIDNGEHWGNLAQLTPNPNPTKQTEVYIEGLQLAAGTEFTIHLTGTTYMEFPNIKASSPAKDNFVQKKGDIADRYDNIVVTADGTYDFYVDAGDDYGIYITETSGEQEETDYKLVGTIGGTNKWAYADGIQVIKLSNNQYQVASVELLAGDAIKMWNGKSGEQESWLGVSDAYPNCGWTVGDNGNCVINEAGTYKVDIYMDNANHIVITALTAL